jgi:hypothetical protein
VLAYYEDLADKMHETVGSLNGFIERQEIDKLQLQYLHGCGAGDGCPCDCATRVSSRPNNCTSARMRDASLLCVAPGVSIPSPCVPPV